MQRILKNKIDTKTLIVVSYVVFSCFALVMTHEQTKNMGSFLRENANGVTKVCAATFGGRLKQYGPKIWCTEYLPLSVSEYSMYTNPEIFSVTPAYFRGIEHTKHQKYSSWVSRNYEISTLARDTVDAFDGVPLIDYILLVDRNGHVCFASKSARKTLTGDMTSDMDGNRELSIMDDMATASIERVYAGQYTYKNQYGTFTKSPIICDGKIWGNMVVFFNEGYFTEFKKRYQRRAMVMCMVLLVFGVFISNIMIEEERQ